MDNVKVVVTVWFDSGDPLVSNVLVDTRENLKSYLTIFEDIENIKNLVVPVGKSNFYVNPSKIRAIEVTEVADHDG